MNNERGLTLLEVLVATVIMAIAVVGLLSSLSASMRNAGRISDYDRATILARTKMDELLAAARLPKFVVHQGSFDATSGWQARALPFEMTPGAGPGAPAIDRVELEVWWMAGEQRRTFRLEGFRRTVVTPEDIAAAKAEALRQ
ncbi:MAG TPA: type II secretion system protein [Bryobacteraceae bacterium]|nr:type II secretion system protein [Bryobacteraceae bacterium]